jgi:methyl-accepting chemotaxis protein
MIQHKRKKFLSLKYKIIGDFLILILFSSIAIGSYSYYEARSSIERSVGNSALTIVKSIVGTIDAEKFNQLQTKEDMQSEYYKELQTRLNDIRQTNGLKYLYTMRETEDGKYIYVVDGSTDNPNLLGDVENADDVSTIMAASFGGKIGYELNYTNDWGYLVSAYVPVKDNSGKVIGMLGSDFDANYVHAQLNKLGIHIILLILAVIFVGILLSWILSAIMVRSLNKLKDQAELVKKGDLRVKFDRIGNDEIGILTQSFKDMVNSLFVLTDGIKNNTNNVVREIDGLNRSFGETSKATEEISQVITEIASGAVEQTDSMDEVSKSMNEVFGQVKKSVGHANLVSSSSNKAVTDITQAMEIFKTSIEKVTTVNETVEHTASIIKELGEKSKEISSFSEKISQITRQTNILSLNASIEAVRAGEQGKGFMVVANEVKELAEQSNEASRQISGIASNMQMEISNAVQSIQDGVIQANEGVSTVKEVDTYLAELQKSSNDAYMRVKEIIDAIGLIENTCKHAVNKINELADISKNFSAGCQQAAASTEEQAAVMQQINENIDNIRNTTNRLNDVVNEFKVD